MPSSTENTLIGLGVLIVVLAIIIPLMFKKKNNNNLTRVMRAMRSQPMMSSGYMENERNMRAMRSLTKAKEGFLDTYMTNVPDSKNLQFSSPPFKSPFVGQMSSDNVQTPSSNWDMIEDISDD